MRNIVKQPQPGFLIQHDYADHAGFNNLTTENKQQLRTQLLREQRGLCCYCMSRILADARTTKIAHWHSQSHYPEEQLNYANLLLACRGNEGHGREDQYCDTRQGDKDISKNPANPDHNVERFIRYSSDGSIISSDRQFDADLNDKLNLNHAFLKMNRRQTLDGFLAACEKIGPFTSRQLTRMLEKWSGRSHSGDLEPFCQVVVYWLKKTLN